VVGELEALVARHPLRERLRGQLMLSLYRSGRQAEALAAYRSFRATLDEQLGLEPSVGLRRLERRILQQDPVLGLPSEAPQTAPPPQAQPPAAPPHPVEHGETHFVRSGDVSIAYQVLGDGPLDLVLVHGWVCSFDAGWEREQIARFYRRLASMGRLILFDKRGTGMSDRVKGVASLEERMDDVRTVMDAVGSERAALLGISEGGPMVTLFAATYPERTAALVCMGTFARRSPAPGYPINLPILEPRPEDWGMPIAREFVEQRAPSVKHNEEAIRWYASYIVRGASPGAAQTLHEMNCEIDVRHVLPTVGVPTLVIYREDEYLKEATRYMGEHIPGAVLKAVRGNDHLPWEGDQDAVLDAIGEFLATVREEQEPDQDRILTTVLNTRVVAGDAAPYTALLRNTLPRFGLHSGEIAVANYHVTGPAIELSAAVAAAAGPGEVLASSTVRDLVAGSGIAFQPRGPLPGAAGWELYSVGAPAYHTTTERQPG
jgi:pimeloyl-ACP methyl ester carboxylesterase